MTAARDVRYVRVLVEQRVGEVVPDIILEDGNGKRLLVEVAVTNFADDAKRERLRDRNLRCIEIDLRRQGLDFDNFNRNALEDLLINGEGHKVWLSFPRHDEHMKELKERTRQKEAQRVEGERRRQAALRAKEEHHRRHVELLLSCEYQERVQRRWERELPEHRRWRENRRALGIPASTA